MNAFATGIAGDAGGVGAIGEVEWRDAAGGFEAAGGHGQGVFGAEVSGHDDAGAVGIGGIGFDGEAGRGGKGIAIVGDVGVDSHALLEEGHQIIQRRSCADCKSCFRQIAAAFLAGVALTWVLMRG